MISSEIFIIKWKNIVLNDKINTKSRYIKKPHLRNDIKLLKEVGKQLKKLIFNLNYIAYMYRILNHLELT